jgi:hypothetical protein
VGPSTQGDDFLVAYRHTAATDITGRVTPPPSTRTAESGYTGSAGVSTFLDDTPGARAAKLIREAVRSLTSSRWI